MAYLNGKRVLFGTKMIVGNGTGYDTGYDVGHKAGYGEGKTDGYKTAISKDTTKEVFLDYVWTDPDFTGNNSETYTFELDVSYVKGLVIEGDTAYQNTFLTYSVKIDDLSFSYTNPNPIVIERGKRYEIEFPDVVMGAFAGSSTPVRCEIEIVITSDPYYAECTAYAVVYAGNYDEGKTDGYDAGIEKFRSLANRSIKEVTADDLEGVKIISYYAFSNCQLVSLEMPDSVTTLRGSCFNGCSSLTNVKLSNNLKTMEGSVFKGCAKLNFLEIPASVGNIGAAALSIGTATDKGIIKMLGETPPTVQTTTFDSAKLEKIIVPAGCSEAYKTATNWSVVADYIEEEEV